MEKINFVNNVTKASAETFNTMQDNIEDAINDVDDKVDTTKNDLEEQLNQRTNYSSNETIVGTWINGKPIYRKVVNYGALPNTTSKSVPHNISNIDFITNILILSKNPSYNTFISIPYTNKSSVNYQIEYYIDENNIVINTGDDKSGYATTYVILEYTKTTD